MNSLKRHLLRVGFCIGLLFAFSAPAMAAQNITVVIDGTPYTCGSNSGGTGNSCECVASPYNGRWRWYMYKQGSRIADNYYYDNKEAALDACELSRVSTSQCYN